MSAGPDVLVVGAGPTGLTTALQAHDNGATVRIVERRPEAFRPSRAMIMHSRTLESLRPLGVTDSLLDRGDQPQRRSFISAAGQSASSSRTLRFPTPPSRTSPCCGRWTSRRFSRPR